MRGGTVDAHKAKADEDANEEPDGHSGGDRAQGDRLVRREGEKKVGRGSGNELHK